MPKKQSKAKKAVSKKKFESAKKKANEDMITIEKKHIYIAMIIAAVVIIAIPFFLLIKDAPSDIPTGSVIYKGPSADEYVVITDNLCTNCDIKPTVDATTNYFPELKQVNFDYTDKEAQRLIQIFDIKFLPAFIFPEQLEETDGWKANSNNVRVYFEKKDSNYLLTPEASGSSFNPKAEICDNRKDDRDQDGLVDCQDDECANTMACRPELKNNLQVFIMSDCPYGKVAIEALKPLIDSFGTDLDYEVHYVANEAADGFRSLHGQYEVDENIIQLCTKEHSPEMWFDYLYCRSTKGIQGIDWKQCAQETGVDVEAVQSCFDGGEGANLLKEDIKIGNSLGISASPTWIANNRYVFGGIYPEQIQAQFCTYNPDTKGCENTIAAETTAVSGSC